MTPETTPGGQPSGENLEDKQVKKLLRGIDIPPEPKILTAMRQELAKPDPSLRRVGDIIHNDISLAAAVLKVVNSPFWALRAKIGSIHHAVTLLGTKNVYNIVASLSLRKALPGANSGPMKGFMDAFQDVAVGCALLAKELTGLTPDEAYTLGLFHDCGMLLMAKKFKDYRKLLLKAKNIPDKPLTEIEQEKYNTDHCLVGYYVSRVWHLPKNVSAAVREHHNEFTADGEITSMAAVLALSRYLVHEINLPGFYNYEWESNRDAILDYFNLDEDALADLKETAINHIRDFDH